MFALGSTARTTRRAIAAAAFACLLVTTACSSDDDAASDDEITTTTEAATDTTAPADDEATDGDTDADAGDDAGDDSPEAPTVTIIAPPDGSMSAADWIDEATSAVQSAGTACEVLSVTSTDISAIEPDEAAARKAGQLFAVSFRRLAELSTTMSAEDKDSIEELAAAIEAEATSADTDMTVYTVQGPSMISDPKYTAAQVALLTGTENC